LSPIRLSKVTAKAYSDQNNNMIMYEHNTTRPFCYQIYVLYFM